jgi:transcriptional regulator with XRE-family HTH domain
MDTGVYILRSIEKAVTKLGADIRDARRRRRMSASELAQRIGISRVTLSKLEKGDPNVRMGIYAAALHEMGRLEALAQVMDRRNDTEGLDALEADLPERVRRSK